MHRLKDSWGKAKILLSQLLCIGAMFTACTDDDTIVQSDKAPLQISVSAKASAVSRTIIDGSSLPDGSHIGVSVFDANGGDYDGQDYFNLKYTAAGEGEGQSWSTTTPASLSTTMAVVTAYFPYIDNDDLDLTAVPVETASQTDYMYSGAVAGANMSSPEVTLNMSHALANIHVNIKKGTYTGIGEVSQMAVKAAAFATTATMNVFDGTLDNIDGKGAEFTQKITDAAISAGMVEQDFLVVPDGSSESGNITLSVTVDGKKFTAGIDYDEAFQQGYTYTYNLTLNNEDLKVEAVEVLPWGEKASFDEGLDLYDDEYIVEIAVPSNNYEFIHNIGDFVGTIDWGDGTTTEYKSTAVGPTHTYLTSGNYIVKTEGKINRITTYTLYDYKNNTHKNPSEIITKLVSIGKDVGVTNMGSAFSEQTLLAKIIPGALDGCTEVTSFARAFEGCTSLTEIPEGLFDKCTKVTDFKAAFESTAITEVPKGLFDHCTKVTDFSEIFSWCKQLIKVNDGFAFKSDVEVNMNLVFRECEKLQSIPEGLFDDCPEVTSFKEAFADCSSLQAIPKGLFDNNTKVTSFGSAFESTAITEVPKGLFDKCTEVTDFADAFYYCDNLQTIPQGLFDKCTKVTNFSATFYRTKISEIPEGLFDKCTEVTSFKETFAWCWSLKSMPERLFDSNIKVKTFEDTFYQCVVLNNISQGLFDNNTEVTTFEGTFSNCKQIATIPEGLFDYNTKVTNFQGTFGSCEKLNAIPSGLFDNNKEVTNFGSTFSFCLRLSTIPGGLFDCNTKVTSFAGTFSGCTNLTTIPTGLFDKCTEVTNFNGTFGAPTGWTSYACKMVEIPTGLFDNNRKVIDFGRTFAYCTKVTSESPYTIINVDGEDVKVHLYERANYPEYFTVPTSYNDCFINCNTIADLNLIPEVWK